MVEAEFDSDHIGEGFGPNRIALGLTVFVRHENVVRLLEFLGHRQEEEEEEEEEEEPGQCEAL
jgi:hypothetical protein